MTITPYVKGFLFYGRDITHPGQPLPGDKLDVELNAIQLTTGQIIDDLGLLQRDDGGLANKSVGYDQLKNELLSGIRQPNPWSALVDYEALDLVYKDASLYKCVVDHTSGVFATDLAAGKWELMITLTQNVATITFVIDGGGATISAGVKGFMEIPFACVINRAELLADQSGSIVVDIWKDTYANYPPVDGDSITASAPPTISTSTKSQDSTLTGWNTTIAAGDILGFNVDSATNIQRLTVSLKITKT